MSQDSSFSFSRSQNDQDSIKRQGTLSLAGPNHLQLAKNYFKPQSFITPDYQTYQAGYDQPEGPIWGLAKPLPHVTRPRMKTSERERAKVSQQRPETLHNVASDPTVAAHSTGPASAPSRVPRASRITRVSSSPSNLQTIPSDIEQGNFSELRTQQPDLLRTATANARSQFSQSRAGASAQDVQKTATHDFGYQSEKHHEADDLELTRSEEDQIKAGRDRLQEFADAFPSHQLSWNKVADVDWEEFLQKQPTAQTQRNAASGSDPTELRFFNTWSKFRYHYRELLAEFLGTFIFMGE